MIGPISANADHANAAHANAAHANATSGNKAHGNTVLHALSKLRNSWLADGNTVSVKLMIKLNPRFLFLNVKPISW